jgi:hypothetical protein
MLRSVSQAQVERREIRPAERDALVAELRDTAAQRRGRVVAETLSRFGLDEVANRLASMPLPAPPNRGRLLDPDARALAEMNVARSSTWEQAEGIAAEHVARCRPERGCDFRNGFSLDPSIVHDRREAGRL